MFERSVNDVLSVGSIECKGPRAKFGIEKNEERA